MRLRALILWLLACVAVGGLAYLSWSYRAPAGYAEAATIAQGVGSFKELSDRFETLAKEKGGEYAYEVLRRAPLPPNTDLHLLGHIVGDELYKQSGIDGIAICTQEFRNACSHTIAIGVLTEYGGEDALPRIRESCKKAPGGSGAYTMCYHGLGHGVLAYFGYDLAKTVAFCEKTGTLEYNDREYTECFGGAIMELVSGGGHDKELWEAAREQYLSKTDPLAPCSKSVVPTEVKSLCYIYLTPHLFVLAGGDLAAPTEADFVGAFKLCDTIPAAQESFRNACFSGIGKEFPVLAMDRDIRDMSRATDEQLTRMKHWCALAPHDGARRACERAILESLFWGGENDPILSVRYCSLSADKEADECLGALTSMAQFYFTKGSNNRARVCAAMPERLVAECRSTLL